MPRSYLIDGHNALYKLADPAPENPDEARRFVLGRAREAIGTRRGRTTTGDRVHVVFDSDPKNPRAGSHGKDGDVSWSYATGSADEAIVDLVRTHGGKHEGLDLVVVTDDRELRGRASQLGAKALRVHEWFEAKDVAAERQAAQPGQPGKAGPEMTAKDFGLPDEIDLDGVDPEDL